MAAMEYADENQMSSYAHSFSVQKGNRPQMWKQISVSELDEDELPAL